MQLTRRMYERGFEKQIILDIFHFIDWMMTLPKELEKQFEKELETYEKERQMPYVTAIERNGIEKGKLEGRQEGRQEGHQEGLQLGECKTLLRILGHRFGTVPRRFENAARNADVEQLEQWIDRALDAETIDAVFSA